MQCAAVEGDGLVGDCKQVVEASKGLREMDVKSGGGGGSGGGVKGGRGAKQRSVQEPSPGHVNLVLEEDVVKGSLQVSLVPNVTLVIVTIHLHQDQYPSLRQDEVR